MCGPFEFSEGKKKSQKWPKISQSVLKLWPHQPGTALGLQHINLCGIFYTGFPDLSGCTVPPGQVTPQQDRRPDKRCGSEAETKQNDLVCLMVFTQQLDNRSSRRYQLKPSALDRCHLSVTDSFIFCTGGDLIGLFLPNEPQTNATASNSSSKRRTVSPANVMQTIYLVRASADLTGSQQDPFINPPPPNSPRHSPTRSQYTYTQNQWSDVCATGCQQWNTMKHCSTATQEHPPPQSNTTASWEESHRLQGDCSC